jgi:hypothetical protein
LHLEIHVRRIQSQLEREICTFISVRRIWSHEEENFAKRSAKKSWRNQSHEKEDFALRVLYDECGAKKRNILHFRILHVVTRIEVKKRVLQQVSKSFRNLRESDCTFSVAHTKELLDTQTI